MTNKNSSPEYRNYSTVLQITNKFLPKLKRKHEYKLYKLDIRELKHSRIWHANGNQKWAIFTFNLASHNHIRIAKYLFSIRD